ncbi:MAG: bifunctional 3-deoxy-7-phosphoheptulonate synthase/chorismate mutase [Bacillaceae bacterium]
MAKTHLDDLREQIDEISLQILELLNKRGNLAKEVGEYKKAHGMKRFDPVRERELLDLIGAKNDGPFETKTLQHIFKTIFSASIDLQEEEVKKTLLVSRQNKKTNTVVDLKGTKIGDGTQQFVMGPCAVESYEQVFEVAKALKERGIRLLRGGAYKPRTSPYDFQGLGMEGLQILRRVADELDMVVVSEILTPQDVEEALKYVDVIQVGARNMQNFELLRTIGRVERPVLLKRGLSATIEEFIHAAEYIMMQGNDQIILCERGIRTYEKATRNTLDISAVPILKKETHLPVVVDVTHSTGRKDLLIPTAKAALAIGADAVMAEVHPDPAVALSDAAQQMDIPQFHAFMDEVGEFHRKIEVSK